MTMTSWTHPHGMLGLMPINLRNRLVYFAFIMGVQEKFVFRRLCFLFFLTETLMALMIFFLIPEEKTPT